MLPAIKSAMSRLSALEWSGCTGRHADDARDGRNLEVKVLPKNNWGHELDAPRPTSSDPICAIACSLCPKAHGQAGHVITSRITIAAQDLLQKQKPRQQATTADETQLQFGHTAPLKDDIELVGRKEGRPTCKQGLQEGTQAQKSAHWHRSPICSPGRWLDRGQGEGEEEGAWLSNLSCASGMEVP